MSELWDGWDLDIWAPIVTISRKHPRMGAVFFTGYDFLGGIGDLAPDIPLPVRYANFRKRLDARLAGTD